MKITDMTNQSKAAQGFWKEKLGDGKDYYSKVGDSTMSPNNNWRNKTKDLARS